MIDEKIIQEKFAELPESVQTVIMESDMEHSLQALSKKYQLHLDQWIPLENEIMLTLLDIHNPKDMAQNIAKEIHIDLPLAKKLVADIAREVFAPIHKALQKNTEERKPSQPNNQASGTTTKKSPIDTTVYKAGESSSSRREVNEDPYREPVE